MDYRYVTVRTGPEHFKHFKDILKPTLFGLAMFGTPRAMSPIAGVGSRFLFLTLFLYMGFVFGIGVFLRDMVDVWIQLSIYAIPILSLLCGHFALNSPAYERLLTRRLALKSMVSFFIPQDEAEGDYLPAKPAAHNQAWLSSVAMNSLIFPLCLEVIQWSAFLGFYIHSNGTSFMGNNVHALEEDMWVPMYCLFWVLALFIVGFMAFQFVFVTRLIIKDTVSLMSLFGRSPFLNIVPTPKFHAKQSCLSSIFWFILNFFTIDLCSSLNDKKITSNFAMISRSLSASGESQALPRRVLVSPVSEDDSFRKHVDGKQISPAEASEVFAGFMFEVQDITSRFTPYTVCVTFFAVANLITHVCLFATKDSEHIRFWTLCRTFIWLFVTLRMLLCVSQISSILGKVPSHIRYVHAAGKLNKDHSTQEWHEFFNLLESFKLGQRSFGFPLTLKQVASIATFLNMSFLIVLSVVKPGDRGRSIIG